MSKFQFYITSDEWRIIVFKLLKKAVFKDHVMYSHKYGWGSRITGKIRSMYARHAVKAGWITQGDLNRFKKNHPEYGSQSFEKV